VTTHATIQAAPDASAVEREREYWNTYDEFDWMSEGSKREVIRLLPPLTGDVLELCIGSGILTAHIPRTYDTYTGLDVSESLLETARRRLPGITLVPGNAEDLPFSDATYDAVLVFAGLHHLPHYDRSIAHACRVLRPGGTFVCLEPNKRAWYRFPMWLLRDYIGIYTEDEVFLDSRAVAAELRRNGFTTLVERFLTPRLKPSFLSRTNRLLARAMYLGASLGRGAFTQSFFLLSARKPAAAC
jgi:ubiquinone/menaquinone biosynthesis C-methylase UbiE